MRRGEEKYTMQTLAEIGCPVLRVVNGVGTAEGGSIMWLDPKHLVIGLSWRVNEEGARQVSEVVWSIDPEVEIDAEPIFHGHIDDFICMVDVNTAVVDREGLAYTMYEWLEEHAELNIIEKPRDMYLAAVAVKPGRVISASGPGKEEGIRLLERNGVDVIPVEIPSLINPRNSGSIHCLTMPILREPEPTN
jgi:N-dimethylarginine dimethylaminohydrolase